MGSSGVFRGGLFPDAEVTLLRYILDQHLDAANQKLDQLRLHNDEYKNLRLSCTENGACGMNIFNENQPQKQLREAIELEGQIYKSSCPHHH